MTGLGLLAGAAVAIASGFRLGAFGRVRALVGWCLAWVAASGIGWAVSLWVVEAQDYGTRAAVPAILLGAVPALLLGAMIGAVVAMAAGFGIGAKRTRI